MAILILSPNGTYTTKTTLEAARTAADAANKTVVVTSALTEAQSNIVAAWPADRALKVEKGGSIANSTAFTITGPFSAGDYQVFAGAGAVTGLKKACPEWFGTGTSAIQATINSVGVKGEIILSKMYDISSPLTLPANGITIKIRGIGSGRQIGLRATSNMSAMITLGPGVGYGSGYDGNVVIENIHFDCNHLASGINGTYTRYSTIQNNYIDNIKTGGYGIRIGAWVNRVINNQITGLDVATNEGTGLLIDGDNVASSVNNLVVDGNSFSNLKIGVSSPGIKSLNGVVIIKNTFDVCEQAGVYIQGYSRGTHIHKNYFEACGSVGVSVQTGAATWATRFGAIVLAPVYNNYGAIMSGSIKYNQFADIAPAAIPADRIIMSVENLTAFTITENKIYNDSAVYAAFVRVENNGFSSAARDIRIQQTDRGDQFLALVENKCSNAYGFRYFAAKWDRSLVSDILTPNGFTNALASSRWYTPVTMLIAETLIGERRGYKLTAAPGGYIIIEITEGLAGLIGKYVTFSGVTRGDGTLDNGTKLTVSINTGAGYVDALVEAQHASSWTNITQGQVVLIPLGTVGVKIALDSLDDSAVGGANGISQLVGFDMVDTWGGTVNPVFAPLNGTGSPEGVVTAPIGTQYINNSGGVSTTLYIKTSGTGNTGWTAK